MRMGTWFFFAFISIFYAVGIGVLGYGVWAMLKSTEAASWPTTPGVLEACELKSDNSDDETAYQVNVRYRYKVNGQTFVNDQVAIGYASSDTEATHEALYDRLKGAEQVDVRYDPSDPQVSVLSFGVHQSIQFTLAFGVTWLLFVMGFTVIWWTASGTDSVLLNNLSTR